MISTPISTYVINLKSRVDRREHILREFRGRDEFSVNIVEAKLHTVGAVGLWNSIHYIVSELAKDDEDFILICEDDHQFTDEYTTDKLYKCLVEGTNLKADMILGGISGLKSVFRACQSLLWIESYTGNQFMIIFNRFFNSIRKAHFLVGDFADNRLSLLSTSIFVIYPFVSTQKEFGYSDVTEGNGNQGKLLSLFDDSSRAISYLLQGEDFYGYQSNSANYPELYKNVSIPTYVINLPQRTDRLLHIKSQFANRPEFDVKYIEAYSNKIGAVGLWESIRKVIQLGIQNDDDVLIICEDDHFFTEHYTKDILFENIFRAHEQGADILSGGTSGGFYYAIPISERRFWVNYFLATQFIIIYRKFFDTILNASYGDSVTADNLLSVLTSNKMVLFPFISEQRDFGYSDVTQIHIEINGLVPKMFENASIRFSKIQSAYRKLRKIELNK